MVTQQLLVLGVLALLGVLSFAALLRVARRTNRGPRSGADFRSGPVAFVNRFPEQLEVEFGDRSDEWTTDCSETLDRLEHLLADPSPVEELRALRSAARDLQGGNPSWDDLPSRADSGTTAQGAVAELRTDIRTGLLETLATEEGPIAEDLPGDIETPSASLDLGEAGRRLVGKRQVDYGNVSSLADSIRESTRQAPLSQLADLVGRVEDERRRVEADVRSELNGFQARFEAIQAVNRQVESDLSCVDLDTDLADWVRWTIFPDETRGEPPENLTNVSVPSAIGQADDTTKESVRQAASHLDFDQADEYLAAAEERTERIQRLVIGIIELARDASQGVKTGVYDLPEEYVYETVRDGGHNPSARRALSDGATHVVGRQFDPFMKGVADRLGEAYDRTPTPHEGQATDDRVHLTFEPYRPTRGGSNPPSVEQRQAVDDVLRLLEISGETSVEDGTRTISHPVGDLICYDGMQEAFTDYLDRLLKDHPGVKSRSIPETTGQLEIEFTNDLEDPLKALRSAADS